MKHNNEHIVAKQCRVGFCSAKWKVKTWTRKDEAETVDYVLMACLTHDHSKEKEGREAKRMEKLKEDPERYANGQKRKGPERQKLERERQRRVYKRSVAQNVLVPRASKI